MSRRLTDRRVASTVAETDNDEQVQIDDYEPSSAEIRALARIIGVNIDDLDEGDVNRDEGKSADQKVLQLEPRQYRAGAGTAIAPKGMRRRHRGYGAIDRIIAAFPKWADSKHKTCVEILSRHPEISDPVRLCAWLKDRSLGTTRWRNKAVAKILEGRRRQAAENAITALAGAMRAEGRSYAEIAKSIDSRLQQYINPRPGREASSGDGGCKSASAVRTFDEAFEALRVEFAEDRDLPEWVPYLPVPGVYRHPTYGEINLSRDRIRRFVANFRSQVYQQQLPLYLDVEHQTKLSGPVAIIRELRENADGSVDARVEWTERGRRLVRGGGFRYVSPEWFDQWIDPADGTTYTDVVTGGAITTRPFFKERSLRPLIASEEGVAVTEIEVQVRQLTERLHEAERELESVQLAREQDQETIRRLSEALSQARQHERRRAFVDEVSGRSEGGGDGVRWVGDAEQHVRLLLRLSDVFGDNSPEVREYIEMQRAIARQMTEALAPLGSDRIYPADAGAKAKSLAESIRAANPSISLAEAYSRVYREHPELYDAQILASSRSSS